MAAPTQTADLAAIRARHLATNWCKLLHCNMDGTHYLRVRQSQTYGFFAMSRQLAISACISILAMAGLALAAPGVAQRAPAQAHAETGATAISAAAPAFRP